MRIGKLRRLLTPRDKIEDLNKTARIEAVIALLIGTMVANVALDQTVL